jgi:hypothetical protein
MNHDPDTPMTERDAMETVAEQVLRERLPLHEVDQHMAAVRDFVEFEVVAHKFDENRVGRWTFMSGDIAEATTDAFHVIEGDGWIITKITRKSGFPWDEVGNINDSMTPS